MENEGCNTCKYEHCDNSDYPCSKCSHAFIDKYEPKTNADKIREMSDEELAEWLDTITACRHCAYEVAGCGGKNCVKGILKYLQSEAE